MHFSHLLFTRFLSVSGEQFAICDGRFANLELLLEIPSYLQGCVAYSEVVSILSRGRRRRTFHLHKYITDNVLIDRAVSFEAIV